MVIYLPSGAKQRIGFSPLTGGGSTFTTGDLGVQVGLESHPNYGKLFSCIEVIDDNKPVVQEAKKEPERGTKQVRVSNVEDAKDYLAETFGMSRTKLRNRAAVIAAGEEHGIEFIWE